MPALTLNLVISNLSGLVLFRMLTADLNTTFTLTAITFFLVQFNGFKMLYNFAPVLVPVIGHVYFDIFAGVIQSFVFVMLTMTFVTMAMD